MARRKKKPQPSFKPTRDQLKKHAKLASELLEKQEEAHLKKVSLELKVFLDTRGVVLNGVPALVQRGDGTFGIVCNVALATKQEQEKPEA